MMASKLPAVLTPPPVHLSSISMERALNQIKGLLEQIDPKDDASLEDRLNASIDDLDVMLSCIERS